MSVTLTKDVVITTTPGTPGTAGSPGTAPTPAYCVTTTKTTPTYTYQLVALPLAPGETQVQYQMFALAGAPVVSTSTVCYPATAGVAPVAPTPGTAGTTQQQFNLGWNGGARSIASLLASGTASFSASAGMVGGVVGLDSGAVEFSYAGAEHALYFRSNLVSVLENGVLRTGAVPYLAADVFRIERSSSTVRYYKNTTLLHTSSSPSYGTQYLEASLYSGGDMVLDASLTDVTTVGYGSGAAVLAPLAARGGIAGSSGNAVLAPLTSAGTGYVQQGGGAVLAPMGATGSQGSYAAGSAVLAPLQSTGEAGTAPAYALGVAMLGYLGAAGHGVTAGNTISPSKSLGDSTSGWAEHVWAGSTVVIVSGTGAGQTREIADNSGQALLINTPWVTVPDATSIYEIRDVLGNVLARGVVTPGGGAMRPLVSLGSNYAYAGGVAILAPIKSYGTYVIPLKGWAFIAPPTPTLVARAHDSTGEDAANIVAPMPTLSIFMGSATKATAPRGTLAAAATTQNWLTSTVVGPAGRVEAAATFAGTASADLRAPTATLIGYGGAVCSVTLTGRATLLASATSGGVIEGSISAPMATLPLFEVMTESFSTANIIAPAGQMGATLQAWVLAPMATLTAIGSATITATYEAYAVNLNHPPAARGREAPVGETTRYTNFPFTHVVRYRNSYYGANSTGLYLLEGTTDDGEDIPYTLRTAISDFKSPFRKTVASAYFGGRLGPDATMTLYAGEGAQTQAYSYTTPRGALAQNYRQAFGKGIRQHRYYAVEISGSDALALDSLELDTHNSTRRI